MQISRSVDFGVSQCYKFHKGYFIFFIYSSTNLQLFYKFKNSMRKVFFLKHRKSESFC